MIDFTLRPNELEKVPSFLPMHVPEFKESPEFQALQSYEISIPAVVCGAFGQYLLRVCREEVAAPGVSQRRSIILSSVATIELLASSPETAIRSLVRDEILENLACSTHVREFLNPFWQSHARALLETID